MSVRNSAFGRFSSVGLFYPLIDAALLTAFRERGQKVGNVQIRVVSATIFAWVKSLRKAVLFEARDRSHLLEMILFGVQPEMV